jgi:hypothetical protein
MSKPEELAVLDHRLYASTAGHVYVIDVGRIGAEEIVADIPIEGLFAPVLRAADGAIWARDGSGENWSPRAAVPVASPIPWRPMQRAEPGDARGLRCRSAQTRRSSTPG